MFGFGVKRRTSVGGFSSVSRAANVDRLFRETFDIVVIGGGITGAAIARDAVLRGLTVALIEKGDYASGTSSRSSKLVHGGLRYLKGRHVRLVRESLRERGILLKIAPYLVEPTSFLLPVYKGSPDGRLKLRLGLTAYDMLAGFGEIARHSVLSREQMMEAEPLLRSEGLTGGFRYYDCLVNDARLTLMTVRSAGDEGAVVANYVEATGLVREDGRVCGVSIRDRVSEETGSVRGRVVVNAAGPWVDHVRDLGGVAPILRPTKGIHLVVPRTRLGVQSIVVIPRVDRMLFAVPNGDYAYIGTTDTDFSGDPAGVTIDPSDADYVLGASNALFPSAKLVAADVSGGWAGVRPLVAREGTPAPSDVSRDYEIDVAPEGMYTIAGGKLTTSRAMAQTLIDRVIAQEGRRLGWQAGHCRTDQVPLHGGDVEKFERYAQAAASAVETGWGLPDETARRLLRAYGTEHVKLLGYAHQDPKLLRPLFDGCSILQAEAVYAVEEEMAVTLSDFMGRRTELMLFGDDHGLPGAKKAAELMGSLLGWDGRERRRQVEAYKESVAEMITVARGGQAGLHQALPRVPYSG